MHIESVGTEVLLDIHVPLATDLSPGSLLGPADCVAALDGFVQDPPQARRASVDDSPTRLRFESAS